MVNGVLAELKEVIYLIAVQDILQGHQKNYDMDNQLIIEINNFIDAKKLDCSCVSELMATPIFDKLVICFSFDLLNRYLWIDANIKEEITYDNNYEWEISLSTLLKNFDDRVYLVVTDDEFYPWAMFECKVELILDILSEHQYFEYFIFDKSMEYILFDTHENIFKLASRRI